VTEEEGLPTARSQVNRWRALAGGITEGRTPSGLGDLSAYQSYAI